MIIQYGRINWKIRISLAILILVLFTDRLFLDFFIDPEQPSSGSRDLATGLGLIASVLVLPKLDKFLKTWLFICFLYLGFMFLESYLHYRTFFVYPHVFSKITPVFLIPLGYVLFRDKSRNYVANYVYFIVFIFLLHLILLKPYVFSLESFKEVERGVTAATLLILTLPAIFLFNHYMAKNKALTLFLLITVLGLILFLQHRSVWMATLIAFVINAILVKKKADFNIRFVAMAMIVFVPFIIGLIFSSLVLSRNPEVVEKFKQRVEDIHKVDQQGTGNWRLKQAQSYWPFIQDHMFLGMRFEGFELPIQFYQEGTGKVYFEDRTGHHFHSFYVDTLFYLGLLGLFLKVAPIFYALIQGFSRKKLSVAEISLLSFIGSTLIYGLAYTIPMYTFIFIGMTLALLSHKKDEELELQQEVDAREQVA